MTRIILLGIFGLILVPQVILAEKVSDAIIDKTEPARFLTLLADSFSSIKGISYKCTTKVSTRIPRNELIAPRLTPERVTSVSVTDLIDRFSYHLHLTWWNHKESSDEHYSFNGTQSQMLTKSANLMRISNAIRYESNFASDFDALQLAFRPLREISDNPHNPVHLSDLQDFKNIVEILAKHSVHIAPSEDENSNILLSFSIAEHGKRFVMFLSPRLAFFPLRWIEYDSNDRICREYRVEKFDQVALEQKNVALPVEAAFLEHGSHMAVPDKEPRGTVRFKVDYTLLDDVDKEETDLDPSSASAVLDEDNDVRIDVLR